MPAQRRHRQPPRPEAASQSPGQPATAQQPSGRRVFVLGAGADVPYGMPTMPSLLRDLAAFAAGPGKPIDLALRARLPHLMFKFDKYAADQGDAMLGQLFGSADNDLITTLRGAVVKLKAEIESQAVGTMVDRLCDMAERNQLTGQDLADLARLGGDTTDADGVEPLLDPRRLTLSATPSRALRTVFQRALTHAADFTAEEREAFEYFIVATSDIESLLAFFFLRFPNGTLAEKKNYLYLVWMLWAFLRCKSTGRTQIGESVYGKLARFGADVITFNYTNFFDPVTSKRALYFHGSLDTYLRLDTRQLVRSDETFRNAVTIDSIAHAMTAVRLDVQDYPLLDIPSIVPPTAFKPLMSRQQLRTWATADDMLQEAAQVVIVGYSFAIADEHFNDILRNLHTHTKVVVVNPDKSGPLQAVCRVLGLDAASLVVSQRNGAEVLTRGRLAYVVATGEMLNDDMLA